MGGPRSSVTLREIWWAGHINLMASCSQGPRLRKVPQQVQNCTCNGHSCWSAASLSPGLFSHQSSISFQYKLHSISCETSYWKNIWFKADLAKLLEDISHIMKDNNSAFTKVWSRRYKRSFLSLTTRILRNGIRTEKHFPP